MPVKYHTPESGLAPPPASLGSNGLGKKGGSLDAGNDHGWRGRPLHHVTVVSQNRVNYAEKKVVGVKTKKPKASSNTRGIRVFSVVELTRIELATS
jgi:hypothetical protein